MASEILTIDGEPLQLMGEPQSLGPIDGVETYLAQVRGKHLEVFHCHAILDEGTWRVKPRFFASRKPKRDR